MVDTSCSVSAVKRDTLMVYGANFASQSACRSAHRLCKLAAIDQRKRGLVNNQLVARSTGTLDSTLVGAK